MRFRSACSPTREIILSCSAMNERLSEKFHLIGKKEKGIEESSLICITLLLAISIESHKSLCQGQPTKKKIIYFVHIVHHKDIYNYSNHRRKLLLSIDRDVYKEASQAVLSASRYATIGP